MRRDVLAARVWWPVAVWATAAWLAAAGAAAEEAFRERIEAEWDRHDQERLLQVHWPGTIRSVQGDLDWPGVDVQDTGGRLPVTRAAGLTVDGRLDEPCWSHAQRLPAGPPDQPVQPWVALLRDEEHLYVGARFPTAEEAAFRRQTTAVDASGAVNGVKDGRYAFHTGHEPNPWWQVDLQARQAIGRVVVFNRLDFPPGVANAYQLAILVSDDGETWRRCYENQGQAFGGVHEGDPLVVDFPAEGAGAVEARFVRIQIPSAAPIFLHLDEVEVYAPGDTAENLALHRPAEQSSLSPWSRGAPLVTLDGTPVGLEVVEGSPVVTVAGQPLDAAAYGIVRDGGETTLEAAIRLADLPAGFPATAAAFRAPPAALAAETPWRIGWPEEVSLGYGRNRLELRVDAADAASEEREPLDVEVETVVFTQAGPQRQVVHRQRLHDSAALPLDFTLTDEGAAALIVDGRQAGAATRQGRVFLVAPLYETLDRAARLAAAYGLDLPEEAPALRRQADALSERETAEGTDPAARRALYHEARWLARRVAFMNPAMQFDELLFVKRFTQETFPDVCLNHMPWVSRPGGDVCVLRLAGPEEQGTVRPLIDGRLGPGHVHGVDLWFDGDRVVFGYARKEEDAPPAGWLDRSEGFRLRLELEPTRLFEVNIDGSGLAQRTSGEWSDLDPTYLPNGNVAFVSERCGYSLQCNEYDKDETSTNLYALGGDGSIRRLTVNKDGDYLPYTLEDGTIGYTRWEYHERGWAHIQSLWSVRPDGTGADAIFKQHMNDPWAVQTCRSIWGTGRLVGVATGHHTLPAGPVILISPQKGVSTPDGIRIVTPGALPPQGGMVGMAVPEGGVMGTSGYYMTPWPLSETSFLVSYGAFGRGYDVGQEVDPSGYAIYLIDVFGTKELIYRDDTISSFSPIPVAPRPRPPILATRTDPSVPYGVCIVQDAARGLEGIDPQQVKYLRVAETIAWPYCNTYGGQRYEEDVKAVMINWNPVRVLGDVPLEADGSARFRVPTDRALYFQLLDADRMEVQRMRSFINLQAGEVRGCVGCHETRGEAAHPLGYPLALTREPVDPLPLPWGPVPISFLRDVQPVLDRHCAGCHGGLAPAAGLDFSGGLTARYNRAYDTILEHGLVARSNIDEDARVTMPLEFGSHRSRLVEVLRSGACGERVELSEEEWLRLVAWIDANGPYHDGFINKRLPQMPYDIANDADLRAEIAAVHAARCGDCHAPAEVTRMDWIDLARPEATRFLAAPRAGGAGGCPAPVYSDDDPDYLRLRERIERAAALAWERPRRDLRALVEAP